MALLEVRNLQVNYGPIQAVKGIDLDVEKGTLVALLGSQRRRKDHHTPGHHRYGKGVWLRSSG